MHQPCLCRFMGWPCNHPDTFLRLPLIIRQRIYNYATVPLDEEIIIDKFDELRGFSHSLLLVCRQVRAEVEQMMFSRNTITVRDDCIDKGLAVLANLSISACLQLTDLHIYLRRSYWTFWEPLSRPRIQLWRKAAEHILRNASPQKLKLYVICDFETCSVQDQDAILQPLRDSKGILNELHLRLGVEKEKHLTAMARDVATKAQAPRIGESPLERFRFFDLPKELRWEILLYTNLVTLGRKVQWTPEKGFDVPFAFCLCNKVACQTDDLKQGVPYILCRSGFQFCPVIRSSFSPSCHHGSSPLSLFLTSRAMFAEAAEVFYSQNYFILLPSTKPEDGLFNWDGAEAHAATIEQENQRLANVAVEMVKNKKYIEHDVTRSFLQLVRPEMLCHLRKLEIVFPALHNNTSLRDTSPIYKEWLQAVRILKARANIPQLSLTVHISTVDIQLPPPAGAPSMEQQVDLLIMPLRELSHMKRLFMHADWTKHWSPLRLSKELENWRLEGVKEQDCGGRWLPPPPNREQDLEDKEVCWEKMVMGSGYDSGLVGKGDEMPSPWLRRFWDWGSSYMH